jgi:hypothetical protein
MPILSRILIRCGILLWLEDVAVQLHRPQGLSSASRTRGAVPALYPREAIPRRWTDEVDSL